MKFEREKEELLRIRKERLQITITKHVTECNRKLKLNDDTCTVGSRILSFTLLANMNVGPINK
jgi:hypothetical protein